MARQAEINDLEQIGGSCAFPGRTIFSNLCTEPEHVGYIRTYVLIVVVPLLPPKRN